VAVRLIFLGRLADLAGAPEREAAGPLEWASLVDSLHGTLREWATGDKVRVALNGSVLGDKTALRANDGDEVALLPPVSGG
jgi:molybdopterin synthase sulfur carrier subunit